MSTPPSILSIMQNWSAEQKLAVYDFCRLTSEILWQYDRDDLLDAMIRDDLDRGFDHHGDLDNCNLELPFEDEPPF